MPQTQKPPTDLFSLDVPDDLFALEEEVPSPSKASKGFLDSISDYIPESVRSGLEFANKPLLDYATYGGEKLFDPKYAAEYYDQPSIEEPWRIPFTGGATWKGLGAGMLEGAGNVVSGLTTPLNLATMGAFKGASSLAETAPTVARGLGMTGRALSAPVAAHGAYGAATGETPSERLFGVAEMAGGAAGMFAPSVRKPGLRNVAPEAEPSLADLITERLLEIQQKSSQIVKSGPEPLLQPHEIEPAKARYYELVEKGTDGTITQAELLEGQQLDKKLREVQFGETGQPKPQVEQTQAPEQLPLEAAALEAQIPPEMQQSFNVEDLQGLERAPHQYTEPAGITENSIRVKNERGAGSMELDHTEVPGYLTVKGVVAEPQKAGIGMDMYREALTKAKERGLKGVASIVENRSPASNAVWDKLRRIGKVERITDAQGREIDVFTGFNEGPRGGKEYPGYKGTEQAPNIASELPRDLKGAKPRFNIGQDSYEPQFDSDLDKALFIIAQKTPSKQNARYLKFVMDTLGVDEQTANRLGQQVKQFIRQSISGQEPGQIRIPDSGIGKATIANEVAPLRERLDAATQPRQASEFGPENTSEVANVVDEANNLPEGPEKQGLIRSALGANKAILTSWDLSAPGRQGKAFILNKAWWTSLDDMVRAWGSKEAANLIDQSIIDHPSGYFKPIEKADGTTGPSFASKIGLDIAPHEEMFNTTIGKAVGKLGLVERSSRAHTAFLNKLRSDQFVSFMDDAKKLGKNPETNLVLAKAYAKFINDATGRGSLNFGKWKLERNAGTINDIFFAPRNMSGQIRTWNQVLNPYRYYQADSVIRWQALKSLFALAGTGMAVGELAKLAGAQVSNDPTSADFRKIKIGDTRIDLFGGYQQFPVAAMKLLIGESTSTISGKTTDLMAGKFGQQTRASVAERFFINKLAPLPSFIWAWMSNREFDGKPFEVKKALFERILPIAMKDIYEMAQEDPKLAAMLAIPTTLGLTGTQTYTGR